MFFVAIGPPEPGRRHSTALSCSHTRQREIYPGCSLEKSKREKDGGLSLDSHFLWKGFILPLALTLFPHPARRVSERVCVCVLNRRRLLSVCKCCYFLWKGSWLTIQIRFWSNATTKKHISKKAVLQFGAFMYVAWQYFKNNYCILLMCVLGDCALQCVHRAILFCHLSCI